MTDVRSQYFRILIACDSALIKDESQPFDKKRIKYVYNKEHKVKDDY